MHSESAILLNFETNNTTKFMGNFLQSSLLPRLPTIFSTYFRYIVNAYHEKHNSSKLVDLVAIKKNNEFVTCDL